MRKRIYRFVGSILLVSLLLVAVPPRPVHAASILVTADSEPPMPWGLIFGDGLCTLREAVQNANGPGGNYAGNGDCAAGSSGTDTITFAGNYTITLSLGQLDITSPITIQGNGISNTTIQASTAIDTAKWRVFEVSASGSLTLSGLRAKHGRCNGLCPTQGDRGGGIYNYGGTVIVHDSQILYNSAGVGGGIYNDGGTLTVTNTNLPGSVSGVQGNKAYFSGGGIYTYGGSVSVTDTIFYDNQAVSAVNSTSGGGVYSQWSAGTFKNVQFQGNDADFGAGVYNDHSSPTFTDGVFYFNVAADQGAGMYNLSSNPTLIGTGFSSNRTLNGEGAGMFNLYSNPSLAGEVFSLNEAGFGGNPGWGGGMANGSSSPTLSNVVFSQNTAANDGGGVYNDNSSPTLNNVSFSTNTATGNGGGMFSSGGSPILTDVTLRSNSAAAGGGLFNYNSNPSVSHTWFDLNTAGSGGGMYNEGSSPALTDVTFSSNSVTGNGGAMRNHGGSPQLTRVTFKANTAGSGGGMYNESGSAPVLVNVTFSGNGASNGGGMNNSGVNPTLMNVTLSGNTASFGGGIFNFSSNPLLTNVILWGDTGTSAGPEFYNLFSTPVIDHSVVQGACPGSCTNIVTSDPVLGALASNGGSTQTRALLPGSSAIDAGTNTGCPSTDQRSEARPLDGDQNGTATCDIGAYEARSFTLSGNAGTGAAVLSYNNGGAKTAIADGSGDYSFAIPERWSGTVTPSKAGCTFTPSDRVYSNVDTNKSGEDYAATCAPSNYIISGNAGIASATIDYTGGSTSADGSGNYSFSVLSGWSGTVTPSLAGYTFEPDHRDYANVTADQGGQDYVATPVLPLKVIAVYPTDGSQACRRPQVGVDLQFADEVLTSATLDPSAEPLTLDRASIHLTLDGIDKTSMAFVVMTMDHPASYSVLYIPTADLTVGSHQGRLNYPSASGLTSRIWNFTVANIACTTFTEAPSFPGPEQQPSDAP